MQRNKLFLIGLLFCSLLMTATVSTFAQDAPMSNDEVISLAQAKLNDSIIINKIRTSKSNFDLSTDSLIKLKQAGISDEVVNAMLEAKSGVKLAAAAPTESTPATAAAGDPNDPASPHGFGIYLYESDGGGTKKMTQLAPNVSAQNRTGGMFTSGLTYGIGKIKIKTNLPGRTAKLQIQSVRPTFYFYLDSKSGGLNTASGIPSTPNEFAMIRFNIRSDNREVTIGKANAFGAKGGLSDEYVVQFVPEDLGNGIFKITPSVDLKVGEYGFYLLNSGNSNAGSAVGSKFFDFGIKLTP